MKTSAIAIAVVGMSVALGACNRPDANRTTSIPRGVAAAETVEGPPAGYSAPPAPPERTPIPPNANAAAPGTDATAAFAKEPDLKEPPKQPSKDGAPEDQHRAVNAQEAAVKAPDTAAADAAKKAVMSGNAPTESPVTGAGSPRSADESTRTTNDKPRHGALTKGEETNQLPKEGQVNNYSSTDLEKDSGRPSDGRSAPK